MTKKMDRVAERARTGREDAEMLAGIDQAQLDAMVGNVKTGLSSVMQRHFTVSSAFPPPTPKTISAS